MSKTYCGTTSAVGIEASLPYSITAVNGNQPSTYITCETTAGRITYRSTPGGPIYTASLFIGYNPIAATSIESVTAAVGVGYLGSNNVYNT